MAGWLLVRKVIETMLSHYGISADAQNGYKTKGGGIEDDKITFVLRLRGIVGDPDIFLLLSLSHRARVR